MNDTARGLASFGRGGDTELIHMTKGEIRGLQQLALAHGGSLTINPHTGLPEAGFLKSLLPMVIGGALTAFSGGALSPLAAAMITGAGYGAVTGDLKKGLMAGVGAFGGAGMGAGLAEMGAEATANATQTEALKNAGITQIGEAGAGQSPFANKIVDNAMSSDVLSNDIASGTYTNLPSQSQIMAQQNAEIARIAGANPTQKVADMSASEYATNAGKGLNQVNPFSANFSAPTASKFVGANTSNIGAAVTPTIMDTMYPERKGVGMGAYQPDQYDQRLAKYHLAENYQPYVPAQPDPYYRAQYAKGGGVSKYEGRDPESVSIPRTGIIKDTDPDTAPLDAYAATLARLKKIASRADLNYAAPTIASTPASPALKGLGDIGKPTSMMAAGGALGGYSDGGHLLKGPGDGMSDNIPATINRKQPARLADGEFVVPADVVSHLGNGSTDAGAKKLYAMLNKVRTARTGRKAQGRQINPNKFMPA